MFTKATHVGECNYSPSVVHFLGGFESDFKQNVYRHLDEIVRERQPETVTLDLLQESISRAFGEYRANISRDQSIDVNKARLALEEFQRGESIPLEKFIESL
jgi:hypothetical protein